jgi:hypothetical protein
MIASNTRWLGNDPVLWFVMMLLPTGPPATKLTGMADVSGTEEDEKTAVAEFIAVSYAISPIICLAVVGSLKASPCLEISTHVLTVKLFCWNFPVALGKVREVTHAACGLAMLTKNMMI